ncbi:hypothetical protein DXG01_010959 [Tephrocybe rancida]|nr:hypothetical protein DXG01_010959 [Tephrocybe rancida]
MRFVSGVLFSGMVRTRIWKSAHANENAEKEKERRCAPEGVGRVAAPRSTGSTSCVDAEQTGEGEKQGGGERHRGWDQACVGDLDARFPAAAPTARKISKSRPPPKPPKPGPKRLSRIARMTTAWKKATLAPARDAFHAAGGWAVDLEFGGGKALFRLAFTLFAARPSPASDSETAAEEGTDTNDELEQYLEALEELESMRLLKEHRLNATFSRSLPSRMHLQLMKLRLLTFLPAHSTVAAGLSTSPIHNFTGAGPIVRSTFAMAFTLAVSPGYLGYSYKFRRANLAAEQKFPATSREQAMRISPHFTAGLAAIVSNFFALGAVLSSTPYYVAVPSAIYTVASHLTPLVAYRRPRRQHS